MNCEDDLLKRHTAYAIAEKCLITLGVIVFIIPESSYVLGMCSFLLFLVFLAAKDHIPPGATCALLCLIVGIQFAPVIRWCFAFQAACSIADVLTETFTKLHRFSIQIGTCISCGNLRAGTEFERDSTPYFGLLKLLLHWCLLIGICFAASVLWSLVIIPVVLYTCLHSDYESNLRLLQQQSGSNSIEQLVSALFRAWFSPSALLRVMETIEARVTHVLYCS